MQPPFRLKFKCLNMNRIHIPGERITGYLELSATSTGPSLFAVRLCSYWNTIPYDFISYGQNGNHARFPRFPIDNKGAEIGVVSEIHLEHNIGYLVSLESRQRPGCHNK